jgi:hypothetical protein
MSNAVERLFSFSSPSQEQFDQLERLAVQRRWGLSLVLVGWLHLVAFLLCYYLTIGWDYHGKSGYLAIWAGELCGVWVIFRLCGGPRTAQVPVGPLELFVRRVWIAYFILAFNLGSMNTLRGHAMFELFPATASLASFALVMMCIVLSWWFFAAVLVMFASGLLMAANLWHAFLIFAIAWWIVLNGIGIVLICKLRTTDGNVLINSRAQIS